MSKQLVVVLNVGPNDTDLAVAALQASTRLCGRIGATLAIAKQRNQGFPLAVAKAAFGDVRFLHYDEWTGARAWPAPQNHAWQQIARQLHATHVLSPDYLGWFWWEPDAVPLRPGWLDTLNDAYRTCAKTFAGFASTHAGQSYMNGVGIWPMDSLNHLTDCSALYTYSQPFDIAAGNCVMRSFKSLNGVLLHVKKARGGGPGEAFTQKSYSNLMIDNPNAVFFHGCTDGSLHSLPGSSPDTKPVVLKKRLTFYHSGDLGDIIYSLPLIKHLGGGKLFLGPYLPSKERVHRTRAKLDRAQFDWLAPLLRAQPYIDSLEYTEVDPAADYDLNLFRHTWFDKARKCGTLVDCYFEHFKAGTFDHDVRWLVVPSLSPAFKVVIHRSARYQNPSMPWREVCGRYPSHYFIGTDFEFSDFKLSTDSEGIFVAVKDALHMATVIAAAPLFIGNQSLPNALALALGTPVIQEVCPGTPDCVLKRPENQYVTAGHVILEPVPKRLIKPGGTSIIELGPCERAYGLGDMLTITPVAKQLGAQCVMQLPHKLAYYTPLFDGLCPVQLTEDWPVWPGNSKVEHQAVYKLRHMGLPTGDYLPAIKLTANEVDWGHEQVSRHCVSSLMGASIAFCPTCAPAWSNLRMRPITYWEDFFAGESRTILQFGRKDYPLLAGAVRMPFYGLRELASVYAAIGQLVTVDTGDLHLMLAAGGSCFALVPDETHHYRHAEWHYKSPRITYTGFNEAKASYQTWKLSL